MYSISKYSTELSYNPWLFVANWRIGEWQSQPLQLSSIGWWDGVDPSLHASMYANVLSLALSLLPLPSHSCHDMSLFFFCLGLLDCKYRHSFACLSHIQIDEAVAHTTHLSWVQLSIPGTSWAACVLAFLHGADLFESPLARYWYCTLASFVVLRSVCIRPDIFVLVNLIDVMLCSLILVYLGYVYWSHDCFCPPNALLSRCNNLKYGSSYRHILYTPTLPAYSIYCVSSMLLNVLQIPSRELPYMSAISRDQGRSTNNLIRGAYAYGQARGVRLARL